MDYKYENLSPGFDMAILGAIWESGGRCPILKVPVEYADEAVKALRDADERGFKRGLEASRQKVMERLFGEVKEEGNGSI